MYLQKQLSKKVRDKEYSKYVLVIPPNIVEKLKWEGGDELSIEVKEEKLIISKNIKQETTKLTEKEKVLQKEFFKLIGKE